MIKNLHIENYALIESLDIDLHQGFSVITGETGAGKSIMLGAIALLLGQRADMKAIKEGAKRCIIEATFDVGNLNLQSFFDNLDLDFDGSECVVRRELTAAGKSRAFINDTPASLAQLRELGEQLIDIHSQHLNLLLSKENFQLLVLDIVAGNSSLLADYQESYRHYKTLARKLDSAIEEASRGKEEEDYLRFQASQLTDANLTDGEQEELEEESATLEHAEEIKSALYAATNRLQTDSGADDAVSHVSQCISDLQSIASIYSGAQEACDRLDSCRIELRDIADELESLLDDVEYNPRRLERVNDRLAVIYSLQKKHHVDTVAELLAIQQQLQQRLAHIDNSESHIEQLRQQTLAQKENAIALAEQLSRHRQAAATQVEKSMTDTLLPLGMPNVQFRCTVAATPSSLTPTGCDQVQFLFNANKSGEPQPVSQIASGGEIARVMLALKALMAGAMRLPTIIFDEIDTGVSGSIAEKMARIMKSMGEQGVQVISITHLPQIAALGSHHYKVYKEDTDDATLSHIVPLNPEERVEEIAHMLSGEQLTQAAIDNARELLGDGL